MGTHAAAPASAEGGSPGRATTGRRASRRMKLTALGGAATLSAVGVGFVMAGGASAAPPTVSFVETSSWTGGYVGEYTISDTGSAALSTWSLGFTLPAGSTVSSLWNGTMKASGQSYTVTPEDWNAKIAPGGSVDVGFEVDGNGAPAGCTINGAACGGTAPTGGSSPTASARPSSSPSTGPTAIASTAKPSAPASAPASTPPASGGGGSAGGGAFGKFAPYADLSLYPLYSLSGQAAAEGTKFFNLAFITTSGACNPEWGGVTALNDPSISADIAALRSAGGDVRVSFGGASGTELAQSCTSASSLAAAYQKVISQFSLKYIDFDVEGAAVADTNSINLRNQAIALLEAQDPGLQVSYTLPVLPSGLTSQGVAVLSSAKQYGAAIAAVNVMAMDYGASFPGDMATLAEQAATATAGQLQTVWTGLSASQALAKIAVTPMIGVNDDSAETFTLADAANLASWAQAHDLAWLSFWSATRDNQCPGGAQGYASATCSSVAQSTGAFGKAMSAY